MELFEAINEEEVSDFIELKCTKCGRYIKVDPKTSASIVCVCKRKSKKEIKVYDTIQNND